MRLIPKTILTLLLFASPVMAGSISVTSMSPAPFGYVDAVRFNGQALPSGCELTTLRAGTDNAMYVCVDDGGNKVWRKFGVWLEENDTIYLENLTNPENKRVGIGRDNPEFKLDLDNDGGIIARGTFGSGYNLSTAGAGTRLIWYPKKSSFLAGSVDGSQWDDANIPNHAAAFGQNNQVLKDYAVVAGGINNTAGNTCSGICGQSGWYTTVSGGSGNTAAGMASTVSGGINNNAAGDFSNIAGGSGNTANGALFWGGTVGGGTFNTAQGAASTVAGGTNNQALGGSDTVGGGNGNIADGFNSTIAGGGGSIATGNRASGNGSSVLGGKRNTASGHDSAVGGGINNTASGQNSVVSGGTTNVAGPNDHSTVGGGQNNTATGENSVVAGGARNVAILDNTAVGGGSFNEARGSHDTISGGSSNTTDYDDVGGLVRATISGGQSNRTFESYTTISGGISHEARGMYSTISGGNNNTASGLASTVIGGQNNMVSSAHSIVGGANNTVNGFASQATIGTNNIASGGRSWIGGWNIDSQADRSFIWGHYPSQTTFNTPNVFLVMTGNMGVGVATPTQKLHISQALRLEPLTNPPTACNASQEGSLYADNDSNTLCYCDGTSWQFAAGPGPCM